MIARGALAVLDFVVGDDWRTAVAVVVLLGAIALLAAANLPAWWLGPLGALITLHLSLRRAAPRRKAVRSPRL
jgi:hypothetical protein